MKECPGRLNLTSFLYQMDTQNLKASLQLCFVLECFARNNSEHPYRISAAILPLPKHHRYTKDNNMKIMCQTLRKGLNMMTAGLNKLYT